MGKFKPLRAVCLVLLAAVLISASCGAVSLKLRYKQRRTTRYNVNHLDHSPFPKFGQNTNHDLRMFDSRNNLDKIDGQRKNGNEQVLKIKLLRFGKPYHKYAKNICVKTGVEAPKLGQFHQTLPETPPLKFGFFSSAVGRVTSFITRSKFGGVRRVHGMYRGGSRRDFAGAVRSGSIFR